MEHWTSVGEGHYGGWESFLSKDVFVKMNAESKKGLI